MTSYPPTPEHPGDPSRRQIPAAYSQHPSGPPYPGPPYPGQPYGGQPQIGQPYASQPPRPQPQAQNPYATDPNAGRSAGRRRSRATLFVATVAAVAVLAGGGGVAAGVALVDRPTTLSTLTSTGSATVAVSPAGTTTVATVAKSVEPSVVTIEVQGSQESGIGSGVIIRSDGLILTNNHVAAVADGGGTLTVRFFDGRTADATLVGEDPSSDLAVIRVSGVNNLQAATFANSDDVVVGELAIAIGSPLGLDGTVTTGVVSAVHRPVRTGTSNDSQAVIDAIQTDTAINPGNSGGPLLDAQGDVIGINSAIATVGSGGNTSQLPGATQAGNIGVGFAIPSNTAKQVAGQLIAHGSASHAQLGVESSTYSDANTAGAQIDSVVPGGPAEQAGLLAGDVITQLDGRQIEDVDTLVVAVRDHAPGDTVSITYLRNGQEHTTKATLVESARG